MADFPAIKAILQRAKHEDEDVLEAAWAEYKEAIQLRAERDQQERFKWQANRRVEELEEALRKIASGDPPIETAAVVLERGMDPGPQAPGGEAALNQDLTGGRGTGT